MHDDNPIQRMIDQINSGDPEPIPEGFETIDGMLDKAFEMAQSTLIGSAGDDDESVFAPTWSLLTQDGKTVIMMTPFFGPDQKDMIAEGLKLIMRETHTIRYTFASEAWTVKRTKRPTDYDTPPSECADRQEILMITGGDRINGTKMRIYDIIRDADGTVVDLKLDNEMSAKTGDSSAGHEGRFTDMLEVARH